MSKLIEIENCGTCPHFNDVGGVLRCKYHDNRWMDDRIFPNIPEWCTLPDAKIIDLYRSTDADGIPKGL